MTLESLDGWLAQPPDVITVTIGELDIVRFAIAIGATDDVHLSVEAARRRGHRSIVAPALFYIALRTGVFSLVPVQELHSEGTPLRDIPPFSFRQAMAGETQADLYRPFTAGDKVLCTRSRKTASRKIGTSGPLTFITYEYRYTDTAQEPFATERFTRVFR